MKLKCIYVRGCGDIFTEGRVYDAEDSELFRNQFRMTNDKDLVTHVPLEGAWWGFEIIQENQEESMKQSLTPRSLGCFQQVADVIGVESAREELQRVIDSKHIMWIDSPATDSLADSFEWSSSPQGGQFWDDIDEGEIPEGFTPKSESQSQELSELKFGDVLHIDGRKCLLVQKDFEGDYHVIDENGVSSFMDSLKCFDEYKPDEYQEQRERILKRWQRKSLDNSMDTEVCIAEMRVSDLIDFVQENLLAES